MKTIDYLINYLLEENPKIELKQDPKTFNEKFNVYRSLVNIRQAKPITQEFIEEENVLLQEILQKSKSVRNVNDIKTLSETYPQTKIKNKDKLAIWQGDITSLEIGAIVNAANSKGLGCFVPCHNCIDNQINTYAGVCLRLECDKHMKTINYHLPTGEAFTTNAYNLPAEHVIHTVGPIIMGKVEKQQTQELENCYINVLEEAKKHNISTVAFCSISTGEFHFPKELACKIAVETVDKFLEDDDFFEKVIFNVYSDEARDIYENFIRTNK